MMEAIKSIFKHIYQMAKNYPIDKVTPLFRLVCPSDIVKCNASELIVLKRYIMQNNINLKLLREQTRLSLPSSVSTTTTITPKKSRLTAITLFNLMALPSGKYQLP
jgi:hypothetical protein